MKIYIKNMVAQGTRKFVLMEIKKLGLIFTSFESGEIEFKKDLSSMEAEALVYSLRKYGLELSNESVSDSSISFDKQEAVTSVGVSYADGYEKSETHGHATNMYNVMNVVQ